MSVTPSKPTRRFTSDARGNVAIMFGLSMPMFLLGAGLALDYSNIAEAHTKLLAAANSAALSAVTEAMLPQSNAAAQSVALNTFKAQIASAPGFVATPTATVTLAADPNNSTMRIVTVSASGTINNMFAGMIGMATSNVSASANAEGAYAPNINFYVLADSSQSMAIAATTTDIAKLESATPNQWGSNGGCAFACHEANPIWENANSSYFSNPYYNPSNPSANCAGTTRRGTTTYPAGCTEMDDYALARSLGVTLRIDNVIKAIQSLSTTMQSSAAANGATYQMGVYSFDSGFHAYTNGLTKPAAAASAASAIQIEEYYHADETMALQQTLDADTYANSALAQMNSMIPTPGNGTTLNSDTPKAFLFLVTDGVEDENLGNANGVGLIDTSQCQKMMARGVNIGVVYTTYFPVPTYFPYIDYVEPIQSQIGPNLQGCASSPKYYIEVNANGDIGAAMQQIFENFTVTSRLRT